MKENSTEKKYKKLCRKSIFNVIAVIYTAYCILGCVFGWMAKWEYAIAVIVVTGAVTVALMTIIYVAVLSALLVWNGDLCDEGDDRESGKKEPCSDKEDADDRT